MVLNFECGRDYPLPIVDNATAMRTAREQIYAVRKIDCFKDMAREVYQKLGSRKNASKKTKNFWKQGPAKANLVFWKGCRNNDCLKESAEKEASHSI